MPRIFWGLGEGNQTRNQTRSAGQAHGISLESANISQGESSHLHEFFHSDNSDQHRVQGKAVAINPLPEVSGKVFSKPGEQQRVDLSYESADVFSRTGAKLREYAEVFSRTGDDVSQDPVEVFPTVRVLTLQTTKAPPRR